MLPVFTKEPLNPTVVVEGNNISLEWQYDLSGSLSDVVFVLLSSSPSVTVTELFDPKQPVYIDPNYEDRLQVNMTATQTNITMLTVNRTDSGDYQLEIVNNNRERTQSGVKITVQCK